MCLGTLGGAGGKGPRKTSVEVALLRTVLESTLELPAAEVKSRKGVCVRVSVYRIHFETLIVSSNLPGWVGISNQDWNNRNSNKHIIKSMQRMMLSICSP